jgi:penicillin-binding protein 2
MFSYKDQQKFFTRRALLLGGAQTLLTGGLAARLYQLQVLEYERFALLAERNRVHVKPILPARGRILDRFGSLLALNQPSYRAVLILDETSSPSASVDAFATLIPLSAEDREGILKGIHKSSRLGGTVLKPDLTWEEVARVSVNGPYLPGIFVEVDQRRFYPARGTIGHLVGYVAEPTDDDLAASDGRIVPNARVGRAGVERVWEAALRGRPGSRFMEVNANGRELRELQRTDPTAGGDVRTTVDLGLQQFLTMRFSTERSAAGVVVGVANGEILAMASVPGYDPNLFVGGIRSDEWTRLVSDPLRPLVDKTIGGEFAPGSTFKMIVGLAALQAGLVSPDRRVTCSGTYRLGSSLFHCWKRGGHGSLDMAGAIEQSCDVYFYDTALLTGVDAIASMGRRFGLGQRFELGLPGERPGLLPTTVWKAANFDESWQRGETVVTGIGQGYVTATPLQLAIMTARLVNGGIAVRPRLLRGDATDDRRSEATPPIDLPRTWLDLMRTAMARVVNRPSGTAYRARILDPILQMGGKTGTSQVRRITLAERRRGVVANEDLPWERRDHALFVGFAPVERPRYAAAIVVQHGGGGSAVAAPIARDVLLEAQRRGSADENIHDHLTAEVARDSENRRG